MSCLHPTHVRQTVSCTRHIAVTSRECEGYSSRQIERPAAPRGAVPEQRAKGRTPGRGARDEGPGASHGPELLPPAGKLPLGTPKGTASPRAPSRTGPVRGGPSERAAGAPGPPEGHRRPWAGSSPDITGPSVAARLSGSLPYVSTASRDLSPACADARRPGRASGPRRGVAPAPRVKGPVRRGPPLGVNRPPPLGVNRAAATAGSSAAPCPGAP